MILRSLYDMELNETRRIIRNRIERDAEEEFEKFRKDGYAEGLLDFGEEIANMSNNEKEALRIENTRDLEKARQRIYALWELLVDRTARFQMLYFVFLYLFFALMVLSLIFKYWLLALVLFIVYIIMRLISSSAILFQLLMYVLSGSSMISERLFNEYTQYGRIEAALLISDYRGFTRVSERIDEWVFTTSHKMAPS